MHSLKILIALATWNRPIITKICLQNLQLVRSKDVSLMIYDDCSTDYDQSFFNSLCDGFVRFRIHGGIERSRARSFRDFVHRYKEFDVLYLTDNDTVHDQEFVSVINTLFNEQSNYPYAHPLGLFRSVFHEDAIEKVFPEFVVSRTCPGVSQAYTREMAEKVVNLLDRNPQMETVYGWDYHWPRVLKRPFLISANSYVEHFARDLKQGGLHSDFTGMTREFFLQDFGRDRSLFPTTALVEQTKITLEELFRVLEHEFIFKDSTKTHNAVQ